MAWLTVGVPVARRAVSIDGLLELWWGHGVGKDSRSCHFLGPHFGKIAKVATLLLRNGETSVRDRRERLCFQIDDASTGNIGSLSDLPNQDTAKNGHLCAIAARQANLALTMAYWRLGRLIGLRTPGWVLDAFGCACASQMRYATRICRVGALTICHCKLEEPPSMRLRRNDHLIRAFGARFGLV